MYTDDGTCRDGHSSRWHPWEDRPGVRHIPSFYRTAQAAIFGTISDDLPLFKTPDMESLVSTIISKRLYTLSADVLNVRNYPYANEMIGDPRVKPYVSRSGLIAALCMRNRKSSGFLIPAPTFKWDGEPTRETVSNIARLFTLFGFESPTLASLSEKVLRATLPTPHGIYRPSVWLRRDILENHEGGRMDFAIENQIYRVVKEFDKKKAYLVHSRLVPSPFKAPTIEVRPRLKHIREYATGWWHVVLVAVPCSIHPTKVNGKNPVAGEVIDKWLWTEELEQCLKSGYKLQTIVRGYGWYELSNFMCPWSDLLWEKYEQAKMSESDHMLDMIKGMMVGLPGRFLRQPEIFSLHHVDERVEGDIPLMFHWYELDDKHFTDYVIRPEYDRESTALSYIGSYIVMKMRCELYELMRKEEEHGYMVVRSYIDCYSVTHRQWNTACIPDQLPTESYRNVGTGMGQWTEKDYTDVYTEANRFIGLNTLTHELEIKAPGFAKSGNEHTQSARLDLLKRYQKYIEITRNQHV